MSATPHGDVRLRGFTATCGSYVPASAEPADDTSTSTGDGYRRHRHHHHDPSATSECGTINGKRHRH